MNDSATVSADRNFDDLAHRFQRNVYSTLKGRIRLSVVERDLRDFLRDPEQERGGSRSWQVLDAGGGQGQMSVYFARRGHRVVLCDISGEMLTLARRNLAANHLSDRVDVRHGSIQEVAPTGQFDLIVCHAVLEWVAEPERLLQLMVERLRPGGCISLLYYNLNGLIYKNLLRTNFRKVRRENWRGYRGSLTPSSPLCPETVNGWLSDLPLEVLCESGIRVFHDYIFDSRDRNRDPEGVVEMELRHARLMPYKHLGRYIHVLCRKSR